MNGDRNWDDDYSVAGGEGLTKKGRQEPSWGLEMFYILMWVVVTLGVVACVDICAKVHGAVYVSHYTKSCILCLNKNILY